MVSTGRIKLGVQAGLLAGLFVVVLFFLFDLARLQPLSTPMALAARLLGPTNPVLEFPIVARLVSITVFVGNLLTLTILHFLTFSLLGVCAVWGCEGCKIPLNAATGAVYGLGAGTFAFFVCMAICGTVVLDAPVGLGSVALANLAAGTLMGGFVQLIEAREARIPSEPLGMST